MGLNTTTESLPSASQGIGNDSQVNTEDSQKLSNLDTEIKNTIDTTECLSSEISSEIVNVEYQSGAPTDKENTTLVKQEYSIFEPAQSSDQLSTDSVKSFQPNKCQDHLILDFEKSIISSEEENHFTPRSDKLPRAMHLDEINDSTEDERRDNLSEISPNVHLFSDLTVPVSNAIGEDRELTEEQDNEDETEMWLLEEAELVQLNSPSWTFGRTKIYPLSLSPIYEESLPNEETMDSCVKSHPASEPTQQKTIAPVSLVFESVTTSLRLIQPENSAQQCEELEETPISSVPALEASAAVSSNNLTKASLHEEQTTTCIYTAPFTLASVSEHLTVEESDTEPGRKDVTLSTVEEESLQTSNSQLQRESKTTISAEAPENIFYKYFQSFSLAKIKQAADETDSSYRTNQKPDPPNNPLVSKVRLFFLSLIKDTHLKINPRPGKMVIYDQLQFHGNKHEIMTDVPDATSWIFSKGISLKVVRGCWILYEKPKFQGQAYILEEGEKELQQLWLNHDFLAMESSAQKIVVIFEKPFFSGNFKEVSKDVLESKTLWKEDAEMNNEDFRGFGSIRVIGGVWVAYEKECFRGYQYFLEEGEYEDWHAWGGFNSAVQSLRYIQVDFMQPVITLFEQPDLKDGNKTVVNHDVPDLETIAYGTVTQSIEVKNGMWVAYQGSNYTGEQFILEKGVYRSHADWGGRDGTIMSIRPIYLVNPSLNLRKIKLQAYSEADFQGTGIEFVTEVSKLSTFQLKSFKVDFSEPSISLFTLDSCQGRELIRAEAISVLQSNKYYQYTKSIRVNSGMWVVFEHANFRGRQLLLDSTENINWIKFSGWTSVGSVRPINQCRVYFRIKNRAKGTFMTIDENLEDPRASKLSVCQYNGKPTQMWFYCRGLIKSKSNNTCVDVIGGQRTSGTKVALWTEHGNIHQKWNINRNGTISSHLDCNLLLDIKGGDYYDKSHLILNNPQADQQTQFWDIELL
uniref:Beta/gamma crystallin domain-containing protein 3-like n=1 Tax=Callorhinchus milii TaxID=7868 RepID=A0A4W3I8H9_CALMI